tara:strand:- start:69 stop:476 length:408 start_codon:yes stop_codon:yes gene_type:complete
MTTKERLDKLEALLEKLVDSKSDDESETKTTKKSSKTQANEVEKVNKSICKILGKTSMNPNGFEELHRFGKKTSITLMPESHGKKSYVDGTRALYMTVSIENTRDGWENFMSIMLDLQKKFESHNAFYRQVRVNT